MTTAEVQTKETQLQAELATALEAAKVLTPATAEFDEAYGRYLSAKAAIAKIPEELSKAKIAENAVVIATAGTQIADSITQLIDGLKVEEMIGKPVESLRWAKDAEGKAGVAFNPVVKLASTGKKSGASKGAGHTVIVTPEGERLSLTKFVLAHATDAEKASEEYKYPHTRVDTHPKFEQFVKDHNLTGFTYETPAQAGEVVATS